MTVFVDIESTGLDPDRHEMWELAVINGDGEYVWQLPVDLATADPAALRIGQFYRRRRAIAGSTPVGRLLRVQWPTAPGDVAKWEAPYMSAAAVAETVAGLLDGQHLVGAVPSFDAAFLTRWLRAHGHVPTWHHRLICVESLVAGVVGQDPAGLRWACEQVGIEIPEDQVHTALGDARLAKAIYESVMGR